MANKGTLFIIPSYLSEKNDASFIAPMVLEVIKNTSHYLVENVRTSRRFISSLKLGIAISELQFEVLDKDSTYHSVSEILNDWGLNLNIGVISEAGLPGLADPGHLAIGFAHKNDLQVVPLPGASSIQTALVSSGFNGQRFTFNGYLPISKAERIQAIKEMEAVLEKTAFTQIFMETPFRNNSLLEDLLETLNPSTSLHISSDLFGDKEMIRSKPISEWKKRKIDLHKIPTVFCIGQM
jgi:16S rRNA (cytidine1402-2'-O)-methyltransferase